MKHLPFFIVILFLTLMVTALEGATIRCADPHCRLCLSIPGATSPEQSDTREPRLREEDTPFGRPASLAVVNPVIRSLLQQVISLRGDWSFRTDPEKVGIEQQWMSPENCRNASFEAGQSGNSTIRTIPVPGNWESFGVGEPGQSTPWNCYWDNVARPLGHIYIGSAWYHRDVAIPADWQGKEIWLKVGGVRSQGWFWVNGKPVAKVNSYCGSYRFNVTDLVTPGQNAVIAALIRNDVPSKTGCASAAHTWGGIYRDIELEATPATHLANVECFGHFDSQSVEVRVEIAHPASSTESRRASLLIDIYPLTGDRFTDRKEKIASLSMVIPLSGSDRTESVHTLDLSKQFEPWSSESPHLYLAEVQLIEPHADASLPPAHGWCERFGVKKIEAVAGRIFLNNKPYFIRGYGDDFIYPETFISPADRDSHRHNLSVVKEALFSYVRHHSHCELPEYFEAADELGIMIQAELPYYPYAGYHTTESFDFDPKRDLNEAIDHRRRYVSMTTYSMGNEGHLGTPLDIELKELVHQRDPGRLVMHNDGGVNTPENSDIDSPNSHCWPYHKTSTILPWEKGTFDYVTIPFIAHEFMNLGLKFDPRDSDRFTGVFLPPRPIDRYENRLKRFGLDRFWGDQCLTAGQALQKHYQKAGIEKVRLDGACDGYSFWTIIDVIVNYGGEDNFTAQGLFNAFYEPKRGGATAAEIAKFNGPTVILMQSDREAPIWTEGEEVSLAIWVSHFDPKDLQGATVRWSLRDSESVLATGQFEGVNLSAGDLAEVGVAKFTVPSLSTAKHLKWEVSLNEGKISNSWDFWGFPKRKPIDLHGIAVSPDLYELLHPRYSGIVRSDSPEGQEAKILITSQLNDLAMTKLVASNEGKSILVIGPAQGPPNVELGWWWIGDQTGTAFAHHPVFGDFPHNGVINPLWFRIIKKGLSLADDLGFPVEYLSVGEGRDDYFVYACQTTSDNGSKILMTWGLDLLADNPENCHLLDQLIDYIQSDQFLPRTQADLTSFLREQQWKRDILNQLNGWQKTISAPLSFSGSNYFIGSATMKFMNLEQPGELVWETKTVQADELNESANYTFNWLFGVGFVPNRPLDLTLTCTTSKGQLSIPFTANVADTSWKTKYSNTTLQYYRMAYIGNESTGVMQWTIPTEMLTANEPVTLTITASNGEMNDSWVGILEK